MLKLFGTHVKAITSERYAIHCSKRHHALFHGPYFKRLLCGKTFHPNVCKYNSNKFLYAIFSHIFNILIYKAARCPSLNSLDHQGRLPNARTDCAAKVVKRMKSEEGKIKDYMYFFIFQPLIEVNR